MRGALLVIPGSLRGLQCGVHVVAVSLWVFSCLLWFSSTIQRHEHPFENAWRYECAFPLMD